MEVKAVSEEKVNYFEEEMKALLAGYISDQDTHLINTYAKLSQQGITFF